MANNKITDFKTKKINNLTGGVIGTYTIPNFPESEGDGILKNSFLTKDGRYIGDYGRAWWYVKNNLKVCEDHPYPIGLAKVFEKNIHIGYCGYSHRGASIFKIGDRLFDVNYKPVKEDYTDEQWEIWEKEFFAARSMADDFDKLNTYDTISSIIPFIWRGKKVIETLEEAEKAALNIANYLA